MPFQKQILGVRLHIGAQARSVIEGTISKWYVWVRSECPVANMHLMWQIGQGFQVDDDSYVLTVPRPLADVHGPSLLISGCAPTNTLLSLIEIILIGRIRANAPLGVYYYLEGLNEDCCWLDGGFWKSSGWINLKRFRSVIHRWPWNTYPIQRASIASLFL